MNEWCSGQKFSSPLTIACRLLGGCIIHTCWEWERNLNWERGKKFILSACIFIFLLYVLARMWLYYHQLTKMWEREISWIFWRTRASGWGAKKGCSKGNKKKVDLKLLRKFSIAKIEISLPINLPSTTIITLIRRWRRNHFALKSTHQKRESESKPPYSAHTSHRLYCT